MTTSYLPYHPDQAHLLPASPSEWLPEGHLAYFIAGTVESLDLSVLHARYAKGGPRNQPFHPAMMVKVLVYGYATGVFSSRKLAKRLHEDVAFRVLAAGNFPVHRTLSDFRALHLAELSALFVQVVKLARECWLVKLGTIAVDGTKLKANASRHKAMSYGRMVQAEAELKQQIGALLERAVATDAAEANEPDQDLPAEIARRWAAKVGSRRGSMRRSTRTPRSWPNGCRARKVRRPTAAARSSSKHRTAGSSRCSGFDSSVCAVSGKCGQSGSWCVWR